jgi:hypothetical protein
MLVLQGDIYLDAGKGNILVNPGKVTRRQSEAINAKLVEARVKNSDFGKLPPNDDETKDEYNTRFKEWAEKQDAERKDKESAWDVLKRNFEYRIYMDNMNFLFDCVKGIAEVTGQSSKVDEDRLADIPLYQVNNFVVKVCKVAKVPCEFEEIIIQDGE